MRRAYWTVTVIAAGLAVLSFAIFPVVIPESAATVTRKNVESWYLYVTISAVVIGVVVGAAGSAFAAKQLQHHPRESANQFHKKVIRRGGVWILIGLAATILVMLAASMLQSAWQIGQIDRFLLVALQGRAFAPTSAAIAVTAAAFAAASAWQPWGGKYALIPMRVSRSEGGST